MKNTFGFVVSVLFVWSGAVAAGTLADLVVPLDAPLSTHEVHLSVGELGRHLGLIDRGTSPLAPEDQRLVLESALRSLVRASTSGGELIPAEEVRLKFLQDTYFRALGGDRFRTPDDLTLTIASLDGLVLNYVGMKLVVLHDRLQLGWRNVDASWALLSILKKGADRSVQSYLRNGEQTFMDQYVRTLSALRRNPDLPAGPELRAALTAFSESMKRNTLNQYSVQIGSKVQRPVDLFSFIFSTTWLSAVAVLAPAFAYQVFAHGVPPMMASQPLAFAAGAAMLTVPPLLLNIVSLGRMRERQTHLESTITRFVGACEEALGRRASS